MSNLSFKNIGKTYSGGCRAVDEFSLDVEKGEFLVVAGAEGSGKSTLLRMTAGLENITTGELKIADKLVNDLSVKERDVAMVFPDYSLYPHLTVYDNLAFGLKHRKFPKELIDLKVRTVAEILGLTEHLNRKPKGLSTLQRLRIALGRIIVREPKAILFDEPLEGLDQRLRLQMRSELVKLHARLGYTFLYATHDPVEALSLATRIAVIRQGELQQVDLPQNLYDYPLNCYVAEFFGSLSINLFYDSTILKEENNVYILFSNSRLLLPPEILDRFQNVEEYINTGKRVIFGIRPEDISLSQEGNLTAKLDALETLGSETLLYCDLNLNENKSVVGNSSQIILKIPQRKDLAAGETLTLKADPRHFHIFDSYTEASLLRRDEGYKVVPEFASGAAFVPKAAHNERIPEKEKRK